jgi:L-threonylcarbamoyladenylate synthase
LTIVFKLKGFEQEGFEIQYAAGVLRRGGLVAFPTETVYGLGALVWDERAVTRIFQVKGRPSDNPLIVHVSSVEMVEKVASRIPEDAYRLMEKAWPGPLTIVLPRSERVPRTVTAGLDTVAVRMPSHPVALSLIRETGEPVAAPSANLSGRPSPTTGYHVIRDLMGRVEVILDAGATLQGVESTVVNILTEPPTLLRPGAMPVEDVERILGRRILIPGFAKGLEHAEKPLAPGMKYRHYAPSAKLVLVEAPLYTLECLKELAGYIRRQASLNSDGKLCVVATDETLQYYSGSGLKTLSLGSRRDLFEIARNLFPTLRKVDEEDCRIAYVEGFPEQGLGLTIMNRLRKAASEKHYLNC